MRTLAIVAALFLTGIAAPAFADGIEKRTVQIRIATESKNVQQICEGLQAREIMYSTLEFCVADTIRRNGFSSVEDSRSRATLAVFVYDGEAARALAIVDPTNVPRMVEVNDPPPRETGTSPWWPWVALLIAVVAGGLILAARNNHSSQNDEFSEASEAEDNTEVEAHNANTTHAEVDEPPVPEPEPVKPTTATPITPDDGPAPPEGEVKS
ncbi:MAG TPA: hypothetical protein PK109_01445 [Candidatus Paceibacterota bacterium]|nr:hypothetical protein [Candidatus Paceibacterota bacterium]